MERSSVRYATAFAAVALVLFSVSTRADQNAIDPQDAPRLTVESVSGMHQILLDNVTAIRTTDAEIRDAQLIKVPGDAARLITWTEMSNGSLRAHYSIALDGERFTEPRATSYELMIRRATFDPIKRTSPEAPIPGAERAADLRIVQFVTQPIPIFREQLEQLGAVIYRYLPRHAYIVRLPQNSVDAAANLPFVRWIGSYEPAYRLEPALRDAVNGGYVPASARYNIQLLADDAQLRASAIERIKTSGGQIVGTPDGGTVFVAELSPNALAAAAGWPEILFIDRWFPPEPDMNNVRVIGGANYVETVAGYDGTGVRGEVVDGNVLESHIDFASRPLLLHGLKSGDADHGTPTTGIIFGDGTGTSTGRGLLPAGQGIFADYSFLSNRYTHTQQLLSSPYWAVFQSNSWGSGLTTEYTSTSSQMDDIVFDLDILICQSQSNEGNQLSRPQAWAKNLVSVGGVFHWNNSNTADDSWSGGASIGPAADGRIKPDLCFYYDSIYCPSNSGGYTSSFGGTSAATPITAGHFGLMFQMWTDGLFNNPISGGTVFEERPHASTAKALLINTADSYSFSGTSHDLTRTHQGWGRPSVANLYDLRDNLFVEDEGQALELFETATYTVFVLPGQPYHDELRATLVYTDLPGTTSASQHRINDLTLEVTSPSAVTYYGNNGLNIGNWSTSGGSPNTIDNVENVFIQNPEAGLWTIVVRADEINQDGHVETPQMDVDYALVLTGGNPFPDCNENTIDDVCDADCSYPGCSVPGCGQSLDCNNNTFPDECEEPDCNANEIPDECELVGNDCNSDEIPDDCQLDGNDCNTNLTPDECDVAALGATIAGPANQRPCPGSTAIFSVSVPFSVSYQWYGNGLPLSNGGDISGALTDTLSIQNVDATDETDYYCEVSDGCITANSQAAALTIVPASISITQEPVAQVIICTSSGQGAAFEMNVDNALAVTYQWYKDGAPLTNDSRISGATTNRIEISPVETGDLGFYTCHAGNPCGGSVDTDPGRGELVVADPIYTTQPEDTCVSVGGATTFSVVADPSNTLLFWYRDGAQLANGTDGNGMVIAGATTDTLQLSNVPTAYDQSEFHVVGFNPNPVCQGDSEIATLTVGGCLPCCLAADVNCDGTADVLDLGVVRQGTNWNQSPPTGNPRADVTGDGVADVLDLGTIRQGANWNVSTGPCDCGCSQ